MFLFMQHFTWGLDIAYLTEIYIVTAREAYYFYISIYIFLYGLHYSKDHWNLHCTASRNLFSPLLCSLNNHLVTQSISTTLATKNRLP